MNRGRVMGDRDAVPAGFKPRGGPKTDGKLEANMNRGLQPWRAVVCVMVVLAGSASLWAQSKAVPARVVDRVDNTRTVRLPGNVHPMARPAFDRGALADSQPMTRMLLLLQRSAEQEQELKQLLDAQQTKGSGSYRAWLTPQEFGKQYGPSEADVQAVTDWLTRQGFQVKNVAAGRTAIEFDGTVAQVRNAFHTEIHRYVVNGEQRFANVSEPQIPAALTPVVAGVVALHNFPKLAQVQNKGSYRRNTQTGQLIPLFTYGSPANFALGPGDFAKIYNIPSGADGTGQSIAVVGQSNINIQDVRDFRTMFGLPANDPQIILNGPDPGLVPGDEGESALDVEWAGAVAPKAQVLFVTSQSTISNPLQVTAGIDLSALYIIDNDVAPVMSESYGSCEPSLGTGGNAFYNAMWQQAAAEGITVVISAGDNGSAGCDPTSASPNAAANGVAVSGISSTPYNVSIGGTDFDPSTMNSTYWNTTSGTVNSALQYMPEITWNDSLCAINYPTACTSVDPNGYDVVAASGGPSTCESGTTGSCVGYLKPSYQTGITPSTYTTRLQPDISLFGSNGQNGVALVVCQSDTNAGGASCNLNSPFQDFTLVGGTSAGTPAFAGIIALVNQQTGQRQGNANYMLYALAAKDTNYTGGNCNSSVGHTPATGCVFNDVSKGNIGVACVKGSTSIIDNGTSWCAGTGSTYGVTVANGTVAYAAGAGYDLATGLGSINVANLLSKWSTAARTATTTTLSNASSTGVTSGSTFSVKVTVTSSTGTPTGNVSLTALGSGGNTILGSVGASTIGTGFFTLSGGSTTVSTNLLPPGTASIEGYYDGDATHGASTSAPLALAVGGANQTSKTTLNWVTFDVNNNPVLSTSSQNVAYGSPYILQIAVTNTSGALCTNNGSVMLPGTPCPVGTVTLTDSGSALKDWPIAGQVNATNIAKLSNQGIAEDQPIQLPPGSHSIIASFIPSNTTTNNNYGPSTSNTLSVTITKASTSVAAFSSLSSITAGTSVTFTAYVVTNSNGDGPTGTMTFTNGSTSMGSANCVPTSGAADTTPPLTGMTAGSAYCTATLTTAISSVYPSPTGEPRVPRTPVIPIVIALMSMVLFGLGWRWMPQPRRRAYAYAGLVVFALLAVGIAGCGGGSGGGGGNRTITAAYPGDANYAASSGTVSITVQ